MKILFCLLCLVFSLPAEEEIVKRDILGLWIPPKGRKLDPNVSAAEMFAEMPLNHLGLNLIPINIKEGMPNLTSYKNVRGILLWFEDSIDVPYVDLMINEIAKMVKSGVKLVNLGELGLPSDLPLKYNSGVARTNRILRQIGLNYDGNWEGKTYKVDFNVKMPFMYNFERDVSAEVIPYMLLRPFDDELEIILTAHQKGDLRTESVLASMHPNGGMVSNGYAVYFDTIGEKEVRSWYINPFLYFEKCYRTQDIPKPDTTTLAGRRIYYSHIDGDGWYNISLIPAFYHSQALSSEVIYKEVLLKYPDMPVTVGMIGGEADFEWVATEEGVRVAKQIFALPNVEVGSHTFSHPFYWGFFKDYYPAKEEPYLPRYPHGGWTDFIRNKTAWDKLTDVFTGTKDKSKIPIKGGASNAEIPEDYAIPRYLAKQPFNLELEVQGAAEILETVAPEGKKCELYQWSGNTAPFEAAVRMTRVVGIPNINGGDTRFDSTYPSYAWVAPIGRLVGKERQIYSSNSNENTYTDLWTKKYFGFQQLVETFKNTETPIRVKPMNVYYHTYSGERIASLKAVKDNIEFAMSHEICPITASHFAKIAQGFYTTQFVVLDEKKWKVLDRGDLQTIRIDDATFYQVDMGSSVGVIGQRLLHGSLYVYLDRDVEEAVIALGDGEKEIYLVQSRWPLWGLKRGEGKFSFTAQGFGPLDMEWVVLQEGSYQISYKTKSGKKGSVIKKSQGKKLEFSLPDLGFDPVEVHIAIG